MIITGRTSIPLVESPSLTVLSNAARAHLPVQQVPSTATALPPRRCRCGNDHRSEGVATVSCVALPVTWSRERHRNVRPLAH